MKKKILAFVLAMVLVISLPLSVSAKSFALPDLGQFVTTLAGDQKTSLQGMGAMAKLSGKLLADLYPYMKNVVFTAENADAVIELGEKLSVKLYDTINDRVQASAKKTEDFFKSLKDRFNPPAPVPTTEPPVPTSEIPVPTTGTPGTEPTTEKPEETTKPAAEPDPLEGYTLYEASQLLRDYMIVKVDNYEEIAIVIAENSNFSYHLINGEDGTLFISVNINENPWLFNYPVFRKTVEDLAEKQNAELQTDKYGRIDYIMSYRHIAGELAMHLFLFAAVNDIISITGTRNQRLVSLFRSAAVADLNINEDRLPAGSLPMIGILLFDMIYFNTMKLLGLF